MVIYIQIYHRVSTTTQNVPTSKFARLNGFQFMFTSRSFSRNNAATIRRRRKLNRLRVKQRMVGVFEMPPAITEPGASLATSEGNDETFKERCQAGLFCLYRPTLCQYLVDQITS